MASSRESHDDRSNLCSDFSMFQEHLKKMRILDDRITNVLNTSIPTKSFSEKENAAERCKSLYEEMMSGHENRCQVVKQCITEASHRLNDLKQQYANEPENFKLQHELKKEQTKLRLIRSELSVEEIISDRSTKIFYEKCRQHYVPQDLPL